MVKLQLTAIFVSNLHKRDIILWHIHANKLLIGLENRWDQWFKTKTTSANTKITKFQSLAVSRPRPQPQGLYLWKKMWWGLAGHSVQKYIWFLWGPNNLHFWCSRPMVQVYTHVQSLSLNDLQLFINVFIMQGSVKQKYWMICMRFLYHGFYDCRILLYIIFTRISLWCWMVWCWCFIRCFISEC